MVAFLTLGFDTDWLPVGIPIARIRGRLPEEAKQPNWRRQAIREAYHIPVIGPETEWESDIERCWWRLQMEVEDEVEDEVTDRPLDGPNLLTTWLPGVHLWLECYDAARAGVPLFQRLVGDPDPSMRETAAYALAWFPEHAEGSVAALADAVTAEPAPQVATSMLIALGMLADPADQRVAGLLDGQLGQPEGWRRWGAATAAVTLAVRGRATRMDERLQQAVTELVDAVGTYPPDWTEGWPRPSEELLKLQFSWGYGGDLGWLWEKCLERLCRTVGPAAVTAVAVARERQASAPDG